MKTIENGIFYLKMLEQSALRFGFPNSKKFLLDFVNFNPYTFVQKNKDFFKLQKHKLNEKFDICNFSCSIKILKKVLNIFKYNQKISDQVQTFLIEFHKNLSSTFSSTEFVFEISELSQIYKIFVEYNNILRKYGIKDLNLYLF